MKPASIAGVLIFLVYIVWIEATWWQYQGHAIVPARVKRSSEPEVVETTPAEVPKAAEGRSAKGPSKPSAAEAKAAVARAVAKPKAKGVAKVTAIKPADDEQSTELIGFEMTPTPAECEDKSCCQIPPFRKNLCTVIKDGKSCNKAQGCKFCKFTTPKCDSMYIQENYVCTGTPSKEPIPICTVGPNATYCDGTSDGGSGTGKPSKPVPMFPLTPVTKPIIFTGTGIDPNMIDIYYLVDVTASTRLDDQRQKMAAYGEALYKKLKAEGKDVRMGLGSFVDKDLVEARTLDDDENPAPKKPAKRPFKPTKAPAKKAAPAKAKKGRKKRAAGTTEDPNDVTEAPLTDVEAGHSFKNYVNISTDYDDFITQLKLLTKADKGFGDQSKNRYLKESQLEALSQIGLCPLKWRESATRVVVVMTDGGFHEKEEDAKNQNVGAGLPDFDAQCHMDDSNTYAKMLESKYPSMPQIHKILTDSRLNVLVAYFRNSLMDTDTSGLWQAEYDADIKQWSGFVNASAQPMRLWIWNATVPDVMIKEVKAVIKAGQDYASKNPNIFTGHYTISLSKNGDHLEQTDIKYFTACETKKKSERDTCTKMRPDNTLQWDVEFTLRQCPPSIPKSIFHLKFNVTGISYEAGLDVENPCPR